MDNEKPSVDELEAKRKRLAGGVDEAKSALEVARSTFADAARSDPMAVEALLELGDAVTAAKATVKAAERAVRKCQTDIDGIRYDERMARVTEACVAARDTVQPVVAKWFKDNAGMVDEFVIDTLVITAKREPSGAVTVFAKPSGEHMPQRPASKRGNGERGPRGKRSVSRSRRLDRTQEREFRCPILQALDELGGRAHAHEEVRPLVQSKMDGKLRPDDHAPVPSTGEPRWWVAAKYEKKHMVMESPPLMNPSSPRGWWEITQDGREYLRNGKP